MRGDLSADDISSISNGDFRFYTTEAENEPLVEIERALKELHAVCIYQSDSFKRTEPYLSKIFDNFAKSIKQNPEEWVKMLDYYVMDYKSLYTKEEINNDYLELFEAFTTSKMIYIPTLNLLDYFRYDRKFPDIDVLKNPDDIFYITYIHDGVVRVPWRNLIVALNLSLYVEDEESQEELLRINSPE